MELAFFQLLVTKVGVGKAYHAPLIDVRHVLLEQGRPPRPVPPVMPARQEALAEAGPHHLDGLAPAPKQTDAKGGRAHVGLEDQRVRSICDELLCFGAVGEYPRTRMRHVVHLQPIPDPVLALVEPEGLIGGEEQLPQVLHQQPEPLVVELLGAAIDVGRPDDERMASGGPDLLDPAIYRDVDQLVGDAHLGARRLEATVLVHVVLDDADRYRRADRTGLDVRREALVVGQPHLVLHHLPGHKMVANGLQPFGHEVAERGVAESHDQVNKPLRGTCEQRRPL